MAAGGDRKLEREKKNIEGILDRTSFIPISSPHLPLPTPFRCFETYRKCRLDGDRKKLRSTDITFCVSDGKSPDDGRVVIILRLITIVSISIWLLQVFLREFTGDVLLKGSLRKKNVAFSMQSIENGMSFLFLEATIQISK